MITKEHGNDDISNLRMKLRKFFCLITAKLNNSVLLGWDCNFSWNAGVITCTKVQTPCHSVKNRKIWYNLSPRLAPNGRAGSMSICFLSLCQGCILPKGKYVTSNRLTSLLKLYKFCRFGCACYKRTKCECFTLKLI